MPTRINYKEGDKVGNCFYVKDDFSGDRNHRKGVFRCGYCDNVFVSVISDVKYRHTTSCGCRLDEIHQDIKYVRWKHGKTRDIISGFNVWVGIRARCLYEKNESYENYGGRGITVCERWKDSFDNFREDMGDRPSKYHSIERRDNDGNYEKSNCYWGTRKDQNRNKRNTIRVIYNGVKKPLVEWCEILNISWGGVKKKIYIKKIDAQEAFDLYIPKSNLVNHSFGHLI